jgi:glutathione S-transferase
MTHQLFGAEVSYYTGKVRAYLRYKGIPFIELAATRDVYRNVIVPRTGVRFIPVLISDDDVAVQDSAEIIDFLEKRHPKPSVYPPGAVQRLAAFLLELYADEWLVLPAMHYRWNVPENRDFAVQEFGRLSAPQASPEEQRAIGEKLSAPFAGALPALGVSRDTVPAIEVSYEALLSDLDRHFARHPYALGGDCASLADFALFGPLYAHLYRDPASGRMMREVAMRVADWVERLCEPALHVGSFKEHDVVPDTLHPVLARMFHEIGPVLVSTIARLASLDLGPGAQLPRAIGRHRFAIEGVTGERAIFPFNVWRYQRAYDHYRALEGSDRARADSLLDATGGRALLETPIPRRIARRENQMFLAP